MEISQQCCSAFTSGVEFHYEHANKYLVVRFLALVTTMVTTVDHGNHRSNDCRNDRSNHRGYYNHYYNVNA